MKKTYKESWFVSCQPGSELMQKLMWRHVYHAASSNYYSNSGDNWCDWQRIVVLQSEVISKDYVIFEVMSMEDYYKYREYSLDYMAALESRVQNLEHDLKTANECLNSEKNDNYQLSKENSDLHFAMHAINYCAEIVCEDGRYALKIKDSRSGVPLTLSEYQAMKKIGLDIRDIDNSGKWDINKEFVMDE